MNAAAVAVSLLLAALVAATAVRKLSHRPNVVASYRRVGVPESRLNHLAAVLLAAAAGLLAGLAWPPVGIAAAAGLVAYFLLAIAAHIRAADHRNLPVPVIFAALALAALVLQIAAV